MSDFVGQLFQGHYAPDITACDSRPVSVSKFNRVPKKPAIAYDDLLIKNLEKENEILIEHFGRTIKDGFVPRNFTLLCKQLGLFKVMFHNHLLKENVKLFCYLEQIMKDDDKSLNSLREFRKEINHSASEVINFCKKYEQPLELMFLQESFENEYQAIGQTLIHRTQMVEHKMHSLYAPMC